MSFLYDRIITITRAAAQTGAGLQAYGGDVEANETVILAGQAAAVQAMRQGMANKPGLPLDTRMAEWRIYFRMALGFDATLVQDRDFVTDDLGRRFQVVSAYPNPMGWRLSCQRMEA
jgi:hypothetical protein